jgi:hypothetical protein
MDTGKRKEMMHSMMEQMFGGMSANEKKDMCAAMMGKMTEDLDVKEMMAKMEGGGGEQHMGQMPEMMLKMMMPHCIGMMLPAMEANKRGEAAAAIVSALAEKGTSGMTEEQGQAFLNTLRDAVQLAE